ncbi:MAG: hypothetical protein AAF485_07050 [Chloroflexota bacterium]
MKTITLYRPTGEKELQLVKANGHKKWPPRLPEQPFFYPVTNEQYAIELTQWNITDFGAGYVTKFEVEKAFMDNYPIKCVGAQHNTEWWIPAEDLEQLNSKIVGLIEIIGEYRTQ